MNKFSNRYNSILPSAVYGFKAKEDSAFEIQCLKKRETAEEYLQFWGQSQPRIL